MHLQKLIYIFTIVLALLLLAALLRPKPKSDIAEPVTAVSSMADACRRLELTGYSFVENVDLKSLRLVTYEKKVPDATYKAEIMRVSGEQGIQQVWFFAKFDSADAREKLRGELDADVCTMINRSDYLRAVADMKEVDGPIPQRSGRATTANGWRIGVKKSEDTDGDNDVGGDAGQLENTGRKIYSG